MKFAVLGAGAWGTALAKVLAENGQQVFLWANEPEVVYDIKKNKINSLFLPGIKLSDTIIPTNSLQEALSGTQWVCEAVPVAFLRNVLQNAKSYCSSNQKWIIASKGIEAETLALPSQILREVMGSVSYGVLSGPSFARELACKELTGVCCASDDFSLTQEMQNLFQNNYFNVSLSDDPCGVQLCAALKNVVTLAVGMLKGAGCGDNTVTLFLVKAIDEIKQLVNASGGNGDTVYGLAGIGDIMLTALGESSRNLQVGYALGQGIALKDVLENKNTVAEGVNTILSVDGMIKKKNLHLPLLSSLHESIEKSSIEKILQLLSSN